MQRSQRSLYPKVQNSRKHPISRESQDLKGEGQGWGEVKEREKKREGGEENEKEKDFPDNETC